MLRDTPEKLGPCFARKEGQLRRKQVKELQKIYEVAVPRAFGEIKLTSSEHRSLQGNTGPSQHGYHGIKDDTASAMSTSGWTHVDARWVSRSKKVSKKSVFWELTQPCSSLNHSTSNAKGCVQATQVLWCKEIQVRTRHDGMRWSTRQEAAFAHRGNRRRRRHGQAPFSTLL